MNTKWFYVFKENSWCTCFLVIWKFPWSKIQDFAIITVVLHNGLDVLYSILNFGLEICRLPAALICKWFLWPCTSMTLWFYGLAPLWSCTSMALYFIRLAHQRLCMYFHGHTFLGSCTSIALHFLWPCPFYGLESKWPWVMPYSVCLIAFNIEEHIKFWNSDLIATISPF